MKTIINRMNELRIESFVQRMLLVVCVCVCRCNCSLEFDIGKIVVESRIFILIRMTYDSRNVFVFFCFEHVQHYITVVVILFFLCKYFYYYSYSDCCCCFFAFHSNKYWKKSFPILLLHI